MYLKTLFEIKITTQYPSKLESRLPTKSGINFEAHDIKFSDLINKHEMLFCFENCSDLLWEKNVPVFFHFNNLLEQWKVGTILETEYFFNLLLEVFTSKYFEITIGKMIVT